MMSDECLEALGQEVWVSNWKSIFKSTKWKEHKKSCAAAEKREKEREKEKEQKDMEKQEKAWKKA